MVNSNYLIIKAAGRILEENIDDSHLTIMDAYCSNGFIARTVRKIRKVFPLPGIYPYNKKLLHLEKDTILVFDSSITLDFIRWLKKNKSESRIIFWYWNPVKESLDPCKITGVEKWSYSPSDCKKFDMRYNTTFYFRRTNLNACPSEGYDIFFVGKDKGRIEQLLIYQQTFEQLGLETNFYIVPDNWYQLKMNCKYRPAISYEVVLDNIMRSKAILDFYTDTTTGLSLRPMEAMFFKKKLITNYTEIANYDFYNKDNVFILGKDEITNLKSFIDSPYVELDEEVLKRYTFESWLDRFEDI